MSKKIPGRIMLEEDEYNIEENWDNLSNWTITQSSEEASVSVAGNKLIVTSESTTVDTVVMVYNTPLPGKVIEWLCHAKMVDRAPTNYAMRCRLYAESASQPTRLNFRCGLHKSDAWNQVFWGVTRPAPDYGANISSPVEETAWGYIDIGNGDFIEADDVSDGVGWKPAAGTYRTSQWQRMILATEGSIDDNECLTQYYMDGPQNSTTDSRLARYNNANAIPEQVGGWYRLDGWWGGNHPRKWIEHRNKAESSMIHGCKLWNVGLEFSIRGNGVGNPSTWEVQKFRARQL